MCAVGLCPWSMLLGFQSGRSLNVWVQPLLQRLLALGVAQVGARRMKEGSARVIAFQQEPLERSRAGFSGTSLSDRPTVHKRSMGTVSKVE